jgi:hypothetical protein
MAKFPLATGRIVEKNAIACVAVKSRGRWSHQFFRTLKEAKNECRSLRAYLQNPEMVACYGLEEYMFIAPIE